MRKRRHQSGEDGHWNRRERAEQPTKDPRSDSEDARDYSAEGGRKMKRGLRIACARTRSAIGTAYWGCETKPNAESELCLCDQRPIEASNGVGKLQGVSSNGQDGLSEEVWMLLNDGSG